MARPNIVMVISHDTGDYIGPYGAGVATPHLDALATAGVRLDRMHCTAPQCSPSRASLQTGLYPHANGMMGLAHRGWSLAPGMRCLPHYLNDAGYRTHLFGFQHESAHDPARLGYQHWDTSSIAATDVARMTRDFLDATPDGPFFVMAGFDETHRPFDRPGYDTDPPARVTVPPYLVDIPPVRAELGQLAGMVKRVDEAVGEIRAAIARHRAAENTLFIYTTDHGVAMPGAKGTLTTAGLRTALLMHWPAGFAGGRTSDAPLVNVDLLPTLLDAVGVAPPPGLHGRTFLPLLCGADYRPHERLFSELTWHDKYDPMRGVRTDRHIYIRTFNEAPLVYMPSDVLNSPSGQALAPIYYGSVRPCEQLYDRAADPWEQMDIAADPAHAETLAHVRGLVQEWMERTADPLLYGDVPGKPDDEPGWGYPFPPATAPNAG